MYLDYFGLSEAPFSITPDPAFIYLSQRHRDALAHLLFGVGQGGSGGFVQLTGEVGTGKTTLCRALLEQVPESTRIALILNPFMNSLELLEAICDELGVDRSEAGTSPKALVDRLTRFLLDVHRDGGRVVVVIDEAQNLGPEALEQVRLLTNLETSKEKLLQIILLGQPELRELLRRQSLRQLAQRITARYHLTPLGPKDTERYVKHRLEVAGAPRNPFRPAALRALYQRSKGVPRLINIIADRALVGAFAAEREQVNARLVHAAADEVQFGEPGIGRSQWRRFAVAAAALLVLLLGAAWWWSWPGQGEPQLPRATASEPGSVVQSPGTVAQAGATGPAMAAPAPASPPALEAVDNIDQAWLQQQDLVAWNMLASAWGRADDAALIEASCDGRSGLGFACIREQGNISRISRLNLPVVLVIAKGGQNAREQHLFLSGIETSRVLLGNARQARWVERQALETYWLGDYFVAWPQDPNWPRELKNGDQGPAVEAVLKMAARTDMPYQGPPRFGQQFEAWLMSFQARNGLEPDGIVGPRTLLYMMRFSIEQPSLVNSAQTVSWRN